MIVRIRKRTHPYVQIDKRPIEDTRLSWKAKGLLAYLLSRTDDWQIRRDDLIKRSTDGRESVQAGLSELKECGYAALIHMQGEDGKTMGMQWVVSDSHELLKETIGRLSRSMDKNHRTALPIEGETPSNGKPAPTNKESENNKETESKKPASASPSTDGLTSRISKRLPTSPEAITISRIFGRRLDTEWSEKEIRAFKKLLPINLDDLAVVESYYLFEKKKGVEGIHRRDVFTFLNNYTGELDRARAWRELPHAKHQNTNPQGNRNIGTANEGKHSQYAGVGRIQTVPNQG